MDRRREDVRLRTLATMNADGLLVVGVADGVIRFANPAASTILCHNAGELIGQQFGTPILPGQSADVDVICTDGRSRALRELRSADNYLGWRSVLPHLVARRNRPA